MLLPIFLCCCSSTEIQNKASTISEISGDVFVETEKEIEDKILLAFCGDAMVHVPQALDAYDEATGTYDFDASFKYLKEDIEEADFAVVNFETALFEGAPTGFPTFLTPKEFATAIKHAGFDMVTNANNHALDQKQAGIDFTLDELDRVGLDHLGSYRNEDEYNLKKGTIIKEINGIKVGFLSYTRSTNCVWLPKDNNYAVNVYPNKYIEYISGDINYEKIEEALAYLDSENVDVKIAIMHWGVEYSTVNREQKELSKYLFDKGVKVIIGSHPHIIQEIEYDGEKDNFVVYSLGNFLSCQQDEKTDTSGIMYVELKKDDDNNINISDIYYKPVTIIMRERGLTPRFYVVNSHKTLKNLISMEDKDLLGIMSKKLTTQIQESLNLCHSCWIDFLDYYIKYDKKDYTDEDLESDNIKDIYRKNFENDKLAPKKVNYIDLPDE